MNATNIDVVAAADAAGAGATWARPANTKHAAINASSASAFARLVICCAMFPDLAPRSRSMVKMTTTDIASGGAAPLESGITCTADSPMTREIAAIDAQVEIQSFQPTKKPA